MKVHTHLEKEKTGKRHITKTGSKSRSRVNIAKGCNMQHVIFCVTLTLSQSITQHDSIHLYAYSYDCEWLAHNRGSDLLAIVVDYCMTVKSKTTLYRGSRQTGRKHDCLCVCKRMCNMDVLGRFKTLTYSVFMKTKGDTFSLMLLSIHLFYSSASCSK